MLKEFREFAIKGNMVDMAVGIVIGAAFGTVVTSLVNDVLMPIISGIIGSPVLAIGMLLNAVITFVGVAVALFFLVKGINQLRRQEAAVPPAPPAQSAEERLLTEIRDLLRR